jgi:DNA-binding MarR family transcriptional regulator
MADARYLAELAQKKRASTAQLLFRCARLLNEKALARVREETGIDTMRASHTNLLPHLDFEGTRLTDLALRIGISKQATFQLVEELEAQGVVEKRDDPRDGRAKLVRFSKKGEAALIHGLRILSQLEQELAGAIGKARFEALHDALLRLLPILEAGPSPQPAAEARSAEARSAGRATARTAPAKNAPEKKTKRKR